MSTLINYNTYGGIEILANVHSELKRMTTANSNTSTNCKFEKYVVRFPLPPQNKKESSSLETEEVHDTHPRVRRHIVA